MPDSQSCRLNLSDVLLPPMGLRRSTADLDSTCFNSMAGGRIENAANLKNRISPFLSHKGHSSRVVRNSEARGGI
jgi:hypothetical protein